MRIAIPTAAGKLAMHFGHCEKFAFIDVDEKKEIHDMKEVEPPPHQPGLLPKWLKEQGATTIIAGGMGQRARNLFQQANIEVIIGAPVKSAKELVLMYLAGTMVTGDNPCDH